MTTKDPANGHLLDGRPILAALRAVGQGDFSTRLPLDWTGTAGEVAAAFNFALDLLDRSTQEMERVSDVVGRQGKLSQRASLPGAVGGWATRFEAFNGLIGNLVRPTADVSRVIGAVAKGNLSEHTALEIDGTPLQGEFLRLGTTVNTMVDQLSSFTSEVTRVAREVGTDGKLGGAVASEGIGGAWKELADGMNLMIRNVTAQVRETKAVTAAVARGDLSSRYTGEARGEFLEMKNVLNGKVDMLSAVASELTQLARDVGTEGKLGGHLEVKDTSGVWREIGDLVNVMVDNVTSQVRATKEVTGAVARGDLSKRYVGEARGEFLEMKNVLNGKVDMLSAVASELTRLVREVGMEGKLGGYLEVKDTSGVWREIVDLVNVMVDNVTSQVRATKEVTGAVARGDLSKRYVGEARGEFLEMKNVLNSKVDMLSSVAAELTRLAREVGTEGKLGGQAVVRDVAGVWKDLTDSVNMVAGNLTLQLRDVSKVATAIARGDLSQKITVDVKGEILEVKNTINTTVDQLNSFASEVTRVAREVGTEGKLGVQARVEGVGGTWKDLTDNVNAMAGNLSVQLRDVSKVATAIAKGDLGQKITVDVKGEILQIKDTINTMVDQLRSFASEVTRVAREVGTEGKLGVQAVVADVAGTWKDLTDNVNAMAGNLTVQLRDVSKVATAIARGDLGQKIIVDVKGEILQIKDTINATVDQLNSFASEVTRVAREVGTEGKLGGQAVVADVAGTWKDLTDNVNAMAGNLTVQLRDVSKVATAIARGDLGQKIIVDVKGEILQIKDTINATVDQLNSFASEVTRVAREVGTEGKLGGQAVVPGVGGTWKDLTDNVNAMAGNLTVQLRDVSKVATAIARGDLGQKITVDVKGEILQIKDTINATVDQLNSFASEVTRVAREVGTEGKLGGQAVVPGVGGTWKDLTDNVNAMAGNLTVQLRDVSKVAMSIAKGDLGQKITVDVRGEILQIKDAINTMVEQLRSFASEVTRVAREVGTEGKLGGQAVVPGVAGVWKDLTDSVNGMGSNLTGQVRNIAQVTTAVAKGDLTQKITVDVKGEILELKNTMNTMVDQLNSFASEVTRVAREVGTDGKLGGQAHVKGVSGTWKDLTDSVNFMAGNLTDQVRGIAKVVTGVANGDLRGKLSVQAKGEIAALSDTINAMIDTLATFADQVTSVAREVGVEGKLGGQADVPGAAGTWKNLTDNVNELAANLTTQVRAIAEVATSVTKGDLTRSITVEARGEVSELKNNINQMIGNLRDTTKKNTEQDWLKTNLAKFTRLLQGQREMLAVAKLILNELSPLVSAQHGVFYIAVKDGDNQYFKLLASYAYQQRKGLSNRYGVGESLVGQCALEKNRIVVSDVPEDYVHISSGLGAGTPRNIVVIPVIFEGEVKAVIELASFNPFTDIHLTFFDQLTEGIGIVLNTISAGARTEELLKQSQSLAQELQSQQAELRDKNTRLEQQTASLKQSEDLLRQQQEQLRSSNDDLEEKARLLAVQKSEVEVKNHQIELARTALQDKAEQLARSGKYKSEFLANMSHELRSPLNGIIGFTELLYDGKVGPAPEAHKEYLRDILTSSRHLLGLINDVLDLAKVESGRMDFQPEVIDSANVVGEVRDSLRTVSAQKRLQIETDIDTTLGSITADPSKLKQVLYNYLSNAIKFTPDGGRVSVRVLREGPEWFRIEVEDSGIGIKLEDRDRLFVEFQQLDASTAKKYQGSGLGLALTKRIVEAQGGQVGFRSTYGKGSTFFAVLPKVLRKQSEPLDSIAPALFGSTGRKILVVEDEPKDRDWLLNVVTHAGYRVECASTGAEAIRRIQETEFDAITLDMLLPDMTGREVVKALRTSGPNQETPVIVVTVLAAKQLALGYHVHDVLSKPVETRDLLNSLNRIGIKPGTGGNKILVVDDDQNLLKVMEHRLDDLGFESICVSSAAAGLEAVQLHNPRAIVLDLLMPVMDGFEFLLQLRSTPEGRRLPVIVFTAKELTESDRRRLLGLAQTAVQKFKGGTEQLLRELTAVLRVPISPVAALALPAAVT